MTINANNIAFVSALAAAVLSAIGLAIIEIRRRQRRVVRWADLVILALFIAALIAVGSMLFGGALLILGR